MRKIRYLFILFWVGVPSIIQLSLFLAGSLGFYSLSLLKSNINLIVMFGGPIPSPFIGLIPWPIRALLFILATVILFYRLWEFIKNKKLVVPPEFSGISSVLGSVAFYSFIISMLLLFATMLLTKAGGSSGVPAGLALMPAIFCAPISFLITEFNSFKKIRVNNSADKQD